MELKPGVLAYIVRPWLGDEDIGRPVNLLRLGVRGERVTMRCGAMSVCDGPGDGRSWLCEAEGNDEFPCFIGEECLRPRTSADGNGPHALSVMGTKGVSGASKEAAMELHGLDTDSEVFFYEQDYYVLSNFSAFSLKWHGRRFPTSEHAYHWEKFAPDTRDEDGVYVRNRIFEAVSAHEAFKLAEGWKQLRRPDWDSLKVDIMRAILRAKVMQHPYVLRKLLATGDRTLIENSWRDDFWGWGPKRDGQNMLGKLWMSVRAELRAQDGLGQAIRDLPPAGPSLASAN